MSGCIGTISKGPIETSLTRVAQTSVATVRLVDRALVWAGGALLAAQARAAERHIMRSLDDRTLKDLGLSRADIQRECRRTFWR